MPTHKLLGSSLFVLLLGLSSTAHAAFLDQNKVVRDDRGQVVHALRSGTCVRTVWIEGHDVCAPLVEKKVERVVYQEPPPQVVRERVDILTSDEKTVYFPFDVAELTPEAKAKLDTVAQKLSAASSVKGADIVGFADRIGSNSYNQTLSEKRAHAVQDYLTSRGYIHTQIARTRGLGESAPITACDPKKPREQQIACLSADRRVELEVKYTEAHVQQKLVRPAAYAPAMQGEILYQQPAAPAPAPQPAPPPPLQQY